MHTYLLASIHIKKFSTVDDARSSDTHLAHERSHLHLSSYPQRVFRHHRWQEKDHRLSQSRMSNQNHIHVLVRVSPRAFTSQRVLMRIADPTEDEEADHGSGSRCPCCCPYGQGVGESQPGLLQPRRQSEWQCHVSNGAYSSGGAMMHKWPSCHESSHHRCQLVH